MPSPPGLAAHFFCWVRERAGARCDVGGWAFSASLTLAWDEGCARHWWISIRDGRARARLCCVCVCVCARARACVSFICHRKMAYFLIAHTQTHARARAQTHTRTNAHTQLFRGFRTGNTRTHTRTSPMAMPSPTTFVSAPFFAFDFA